jgi:hypothetical protein
MVQATNRMRVFLALFRKNSVSLPGNIVPNLNCCASILKRGAMRQGNKKVVNFATRTNDFAQRLESGIRHCEQASQTQQWPCQQRATTF